ncbi:sulfite oxidase [Plastoroseomonas arctica]|uniref:Sulfite oxidase n=1 Tax=Plastoroseomonas arctica TaxID=1509237 RepID=A0AAF1K5X7_9PROT|nr:sulfite oxidase [Plastoroseomonas arctica]MBR0657153.1 sulfite oxidase [Plastoroseomonas arctica]
MTQDQHRMPDAHAVVTGRRGAMTGTSLMTLGATMVAAPLVAKLVGESITPAAAQAAAPETLRMQGKAPLVVLGDRPLVAETPETLLDDAVTPAEKMFIRMNGRIPEPVADPGAWRFRVEGELNAPLELSVAELQARFEVVTLQLQMECGGNGRAQFQPQTRGNQWTSGAISNAEWTGVRLRDVLNAAGLKPGAAFTGHVGADPHLSGEAGRLSISRGMPIAKAMDETTLLAFRMNGAAIPNVHGAPLRLIVPGWPGSLSQKWLTKILVRATPHDGAGMGGTSYRVPVRPIVPGSENNGRDFADMTSMPVRSILTNVAHGTRLPAGMREIDLRGAAWAGDDTVSALHVSVDYGASWQAMQVAAPANRHAWQRWTGKARFASDGYFEIWYRATDDKGRMQPHAAANWNPQGYGANAISRVAVLVG